MANNASAGATPVVADAMSAQTDPAQGAAEAATAPDEQLGDSGRKALEAERKAAREATKRAEAAEKALADIRAAQMTESEKRDAELEVLRKAQSDWQRERNEMLLANTVERQASKLGFADPADALAMLDRTSIETGDDGRPANVDTLLSDLAKSKPYLLARRVTGSADASGSAVQPGLPTFTRAQLRDHAFFTEHRTEIEAALRAGRISG